MYTVFVVKKTNNKICLGAALSSNQLFPPSSLSANKPAVVPPACVGWAARDIEVQTDFLESPSSIREAYYRSSCCRRYLLDVITMFLSALKKPRLTLTSRPAYQLGRSSNEGLISVNGGKKWGRTSDYRPASGLVLFLTWKHHANLLDKVLIYCLWCKIVN